MNEELLQDTKIISLYKAIIGASDTNDLDYEVKTNLQENIIKLYLRARFFSFGKDIASHKKQEQRNLKFKSKVLRNDINRSFRQISIYTPFKLHVLLCLIVDGGLNFCF